MKNIKVSLTFLALVFLFINSFAQEMHISSNLDMSIEKVKLKRVTKTSGDLRVAPKDKKWLIIEAVFKTRNTKKEKLYINKFVVVNGKDIEEDELEDELLDYDYYIKIRKKRKEKLVFIVDENFMTGKLQYQNKELIEITIPKNSKIGESKIIK